MFIRAKLLDFSDILRYLDNVDCEKYSDNYVNVNTNHISLYKYISREGNKVKLLIWINAGDRTSKVEVEVSFDAYREIQRITRE